MAEGPMVQEVPTPPPQNQIPVGGLPAVAVVHSALATELQDLAPATIVLQVCVPEGADSVNKIHQLTLLYEL